VRVNKFLYNHEMAPLTYIK